MGGVSERLRLRRCVWFVGRRGEGERESTE
jgi:hypothetical protein